MVNPSVSRKEGIHCEGTFKRGSRTGQTCDALVLGKDDISVVCTNSKCGTPHELIRLLNEALEHEYLTPEQVLRAVPSLKSKKEIRKMKVIKGTGYWTKRVQDLAESVFKDNFLDGDANNPDHVDQTIGSTSRSAKGVSIVVGIRSREHTLYISNLVSLIGDDTHTALFSSEGLQKKVYVYVFESHYMKDARRFARRLETLTKTQKVPTEVVIEQNF